MGEYTHKGGRTVKIATMDEAFWSRAELLKAQADGWRKADGEGYDNLAELLSDPGTLYSLPPRAPRVFGMETVEYPPARVWFTAPLALAAKMHHKQAAGTIGHPDHFQRIYLPCPYTPEGRTFCKASAPERFRLAAVGERYDAHGAGRTIFQCHGCEALFSLGKAEIDSLDATNAFDGEGDARRQWLTLLARPETVTT
jgi:hypothetical protein